MRCSRHVKNALCAITEKHTGASALPQSGEEAGQHEKLRNGHLRASVFRVCSVAVNRICACIPETHIALALSLAACQKGYRVRFTTAASLVHELIEAKDEKRLLQYHHKQTAIHELLIRGCPPLTLLKRAQSSRS